jgi:hypothetical protein
VGTLEPYRLRVPKPIQCEDTSAAAAERVVLTTPIAAAGLFRDRGAHVSGEGCTVAAESGEDATLLVTVHILCK